MSDNDVLAALFGGAGYGGVNRGADADLAAFDRTITLNDPWRLAAAPVFGAKFDTSTWNPMQTLGVTAGQAFLGTMLNALGQRSEAQQLEKVAQVLPQLYSNPSSVSVPEGVDPEAFGALKLAAMDRAVKGQSSFMGDLFSKKLDLALAGLTEEAKAAGKIKGETSAYADLKTEHPNDPKFKAARDIEKDIAARIAKLPSYVQFNDIDANFRTLKKLAQEDSRPASVGMISALARIWDPGGTVREGEYALNADAQSALDQAYGNWREIVMGKGKLGTEGKLDIIGAAARKYNEFGQKYGSEREDLYKALENQGGLRANVPSPGFDKFDYAQFSLPTGPGQSLSILQREAAALKEQNYGRDQIAQMLRQKYGQ